MHHPLKTYIFMFKSNLENGLKSKLDGCVSGRSEFPALSLICPNNPQSPPKEPQSLIPLFLKWLPISLLSFCSHKDFQYYSISLAISPPHNLVARAPPPPNHQALLHCNVQALLTINLNTTSRLNPPAADSTTHNSTTIVNRPNLTTNTDTHS